MINLTKPKMGCNTPLGERNPRYNLATPRNGHMCKCVMFLLGMNNQRCSDSEKASPSIMRQIVWIKRDMQGTSYDLLMLCSLDIQITYILYTRNVM